MLAWTCLETQNEKKNIKKKKEKKRNRKCYYEVFKSKLASKHMFCLLLPLFFLSFFLLISLFCSKDLFFEILYIVDDI